MAVFDKVLAEHTAGSPMEEGLLWTYLNMSEIVDEMKLKGANVSRTVVKKLLRAAGFVKRKSQKKVATGESKGRNEQFDNIKKIIKRHKKKGDAIISIDGKKKRT
jgi:(2Fe-2S) ferredoxin